MSTLVQTIKKKLGHHPKPIDPNAEGMSETLQPGKTDHFVQGAGAAVLAGIYKYGRTKEGANAILNGTGIDWISAIFHGNENDVVQRVASYGGKGTDESRSAMANIANEAVACIRESVGKDADERTVKTFLVAQRHEILSYLPAELNMGEVLNDGTLDDRTNKMDGPISTFVHAVGATFSKNSDDRKEDKDWD